MRYIDSKAIRARYLFPITAPPVRDVLLTFDNFVRSYGSNDSRHPLIDLENAALVPWLTNFHTHLELSGFAQSLGDPSRGFPAWIRDVIDWRRGQAGTPDEQAARRQQAIHQGLRESNSHGVRTVYDIASPGWNAADYATSAVDVRLFQEVLGLSTARADELFVQAEQSIRGWPRPVGLSPHAPYTVGIELLDRLARLSAAYRFPLAMHLAESLDELELLRSHSGSFYALLHDLGAWDPSAFPRGIAILDYLRVLAASHSALVIHGNYLTEAELDFLALHRNLSVVFCPRTHAYFGHGRYPLPEMLQRGINVHVGTDSRASNPDLNLWNELRWIADSYPELSLDTILRLAVPTSRMPQTPHGFLTPGLWASFVVVDLPPEEAADPYELLFDPRSTVREGYWNGQRITF